MRFNSAVVSSFLFACAFLVGRHLERCNRGSLTVEQSNLVSASSDMFAKSICIADAGTFQSIRATFRAATSFGPSPSAADFGIFIDDPNENGASLLALVSFGHYDNNGPYWVAWYQWFGGGPVGRVPDFPISVGDEIVLTITAHSSTSAIVIFDNISQGHHFSKQLRSSNGLRLAEAAWFIGKGDNDILPNFVMMNVTSTEAIGTFNGRRVHDGGSCNLYPMGENGQTLISVTPDEFCDACLIFQQES